MTDDGVLVQWMGVRNRRKNQGRRESTAFDPFVLRQRTYCKMDFAALEPQQEIVLVVFDQFQLNQRKQSAITKQQFGKQVLQNLR